LRVRFKRPSVGCDAFGPVFSPTYDAVAAADMYGIEMPLHNAAFKNYDVDLLDRHLLRDISGTSFKRNDPVTPKMLAELRRAPLWGQVQAV
jgi:hypothetical protein